MAVPPGGDVEAPATEETDLREQKRRASILLASLRKTTTSQKVAEPTHKAAAATAAVELESEEAARGTPSAPLPAASPSPEVLPERSPTNDTAAMPARSPTAEPEAPSRRTRSASKKRDREEEEQRAQEEQRLQKRRVQPRAGGRGSNEDPLVLFHRLRMLDPDVKMEEYFCARTSDGSASTSGGSTGQWDIFGLREDLELTQQYVASDLDMALRPLREEIKTITETMEKKDGPWHVIPGRVLLADAVTARNVQLLHTLGVTRVVNCSPQTSRTGKGYYGPEVQYLELWADDLCDYCVMQDFDAVWDFCMSDGDTPARGVSLLHCEQGVNRSGALVVAIHMRLNFGKGRELPAAESLRRSWRHVAEKRGRVVTNPSFQRQLMLFSRLGMRWFPTMNALWQTPKERNMSQFRKFAERIAWQVATKQLGWRLERQWRFVVYVRDGTMHCEVKMDPPCDLSSEDATLKADKRIRVYARKALKKIAAEAAA